jgi:hypothetical protein
MPSASRPAERAPATIGRTSPPAIPAAVHEFLLRAGRSDHLAGRRAGVGGQTFHPRQI